MAMLLVFACKGGPVKKPEQVGKDSAVQVSDGELLNSDSRETRPFRGPYTEHGIFGIRDHEVRIQTFYYYDPDSYDDYSKGTFILLRDPARKVADTIPLDIDESYLHDLDVDDMTDSLKFNSLVVKVSYRGSSDVSIDEFVEYKNGRLKHLFTIDFLQQIRRIDEHTLGAIVQGRDDVMAWGYDYPVMVDLRTGSMTGDMPDTQIIKLPTVTLEPISVLRRSGEDFSQPMKVKTGTEVFIDTFFRKTGWVRMLLPDSTAVYIQNYELRENIQTNTAG